MQRRSDASATKSAEQAGTEQLGAQRRQLTVMFCDLVGSTGLANRLDPEEMRGVLRRFHAAVASAVAPYEGHVAQLLGDGVLVYFGYPRAHEDDAGRALYPVVQQLKLAAGITGSDSAPQQRQKVAGMAAALPPQGQAALLRLMGLPDDGVGAEEAQMPLQQKARTLNALVDLMSNLSRQQTVLLWVEDAHWIDPTTQELIAMIADRLRDARLFTLVTCRPESMPELGKPAHLTHLTLNRLGQRQCAALIDVVTLGQPLPQEVQAQIIRKTDGVPLFVEELTKTVLQSGLLEQSATGYRLTGPLPDLAIPSTLQDSLMARLDRLSEAKEVAQAGAAIGREFSRSLLSAVLQTSAAAQLDKSLADLEGADLLIRRREGPSATYSFKHALVRDTAYNSMLKTQRALRHSQIAAALEQLDPGTIAGWPELLAHHYQEAGESHRASELWAEAGRLAVTRGANREAAAAFERALALLEGLPQSTQTETEALDIRIALGPVLFGQYNNSADVEAIYQQAKALAEKLADRQRLFQVQWGLNFTRYLAGRYADALQPARRLLELASRDDDGGEQIEAHHAMWGILCASGQPVEAVVHLDQVSALYQSQRHSYLRYRYAGHDPGACCSTWMAVSSWLIGFPERAQRELAALRAHIDELQHPMTNILLGIAGWVHYRLGDFAMAARCGAEFVNSATKYGFQALAQPAIVLAELAQPAAFSGVRLRELDEHVAQAKSSEMLKLLMRSILIDRCMASGDIDLAKVLLATLLSAKAAMHRAEFLRVQGALMLECATPDPGSAETCFESAIQVAREQGAKSFELRAATSLATLWHEQGKRNEARELLGGVYAWFTEGFNTPDLQRAKSLLDDWAIA